MLELDCLDEQINRYYDNEMNESELIAFEAKLATFKGIKEYAEEKCFENFKISNSIKLAKIRAQQKNQANISMMIEKTIKEKSLFNINSVFFQCVNKILCSGFLNFKRNNSK